MVPQVTEETFEGVQIMPQERVQNRTVEQFVDVPVPKSKEKNVEVEVVPNIPMVRTLERVVEQIVDVQATQVMEKTTKIQKITQQVVNTQYQLQKVS